MTNKKPFIAVMLLCYNYGHLLQKSLDAIKAQKYDDYCLFFVDNGSIDNSKEVFEKFCNDNPSVNTQYFKVNPNKGPIHGWNEALKHVDAEYVMFHDADDWMEPDCLAKLAAVARETKADRVIGQYRDVLPDGSIYKERPFDKKSVDYPSFMLQGSIFKLSVIRDNHVEIPEEPWFIGYDYWLSSRFYLVDGVKQALVRDDIYNYFYNPLSITQGMKDDDWKKNQDIGCLANVRLIGQLLDGYNDIKKRDIVVWHCIYNCMADLARAYIVYPKSDAKKYGDRMMDCIRREMPYYKRNKRLWPIHNGFPIKVSVLTFIIFCLEECHLLGLLRLASRKKVGNYIKE